MEGNGDIAAKNYLTPKRSSLHSPPDYSLRCLTLWQNLPPCVPFYLASSVRHAGFPGALRCKLLLLFLLSGAHLVLSYCLS